MSEQVKKSKKELLLEKKAQIEAQLKAVEAKEKQADRKLDTRRKVILGAALLKEAETNESYAKCMATLVSRMTEKDAKLFTFLRNV